MPVSSLARIFGPIIVGHSCPDPDVQLTLKETRKQHSVSVFSRMKPFNANRCDFLDHGKAAAHSE